MFEGYDEDEQTEFRAEGGRNSTVSPEKAASSRMSHGIYSRHVNYYKSLEVPEQQFLDALLNVMCATCGIEGVDKPDVIFQRSQIRNAIVDYWRSKKVFEDPNADDRLMREARRLNDNALEKFREIGLIGEDETSIQQYYPGSGGMFD